MAAIEPNGDRPQPGLAILRKSSRASSKAAWVGRTCRGSFLRECAWRRPSLPPRVRPPVPYLPIVWRLPFAMRTQKDLAPVFAREAETETREGAIPDIGVAGRR